MKILASPLVAFRIFSDLKKGILVVRMVLQPWSKHEEISYTSLFMRFFADWSSRNVDRILRDQ